MPKIILASKSKVRKEILDKNKIFTEVQPSNVDEDIIKKSLLKENASPEIISKNLAEIKANKVSQKNLEAIVKEIKMNFESQNQKTYKKSNQKGSSNNNLNFLIKKREN